jgi:hypothetical protein
MPLVTLVNACWELLEKEGVIEEATVPAAGRSNVSSPVF